MNEPVVSIGIVSDKEVRFDLYGEFAIKGFEKKLSGKLKAKLKDGRITICYESNEIFSAEEIIFIPNDLETESFLLRDVIIGKNFHWQKKENQRFRGQLKLIKEKDSITAINILQLEEYLTSVISSEMSPNSSLEFLKAHAIVSRSWLLAQLDKKKEITTSKSINEIQSEEEIIRWYNREDHTNYDFCADDHCQRYQGVQRITNDNSVSAIIQTRGLVLTYNGSICDARYSKCCGGITEAFENVWESVPHKYLSSIVDNKFELADDELDLTQERFAVRWIRGNPTAFCNTTERKVLSQILVDFDRPTNDFFRWQIKYAQEEIAALIKTKSGIDFGSIKDLVAVKRGNSARIIKLKIIGTKRSLVIGKELEIRRTLSQSHLYSSAFVVTKENIVNGVPQNIILQGAGWGHGVGLCQIGAAVMAWRGYSFDEILAHYFRTATIHKVYS